MNKFKYFLECYFNTSANYDELKLLVKEFVETEQNSYVSELKKEIKEMIIHENWSEISACIKTVGGRILDEKQTESLVMYIYEILEYGYENKKNFSYDKK